MRLQGIQHVPFETLAGIETWAQAQEYPLQVSRLYGGDELPELSTFDWLIVMGGPMSVGDERLYPWLSAEKTLIKESIEGGKVVIGICLGAQLIADVLGAPVRRADYREVGWHPVNLLPCGKESPAFEGFPETFQALHWHGDSFDLPEGSLHLARSEGCENQAFLFDDRIFGLQFHLELREENLNGLIRNCPRDLVPGRFIQTPEEILNPSRIRESGRLMTRLLDNLKLTFAH